MSTSKKILSLTFGLLHMRWFNVCCLCILRISLRLKISITCVTPALCSNGQNFPAKRLRKILAYQIRMRQLFKKIQAQVNEYYTTNKCKQIFYCLQSQYCQNLQILQALCLELFNKSLRDFCNCCSFITNY